jgi:hypothetical protein
VVFALQTMSHGEIFVTVRESEAAELGRVNERRGVLDEGPDRELNSKIRFNEEMSRVRTPCDRDDTSDALIDTAAPLRIIEREDLDGRTTKQSTEDVLRILREVDLVDLIDAGEDVQ